MSQQPVPPFAHHFAFVTFDEPSMKALTCFQGLDLASCFKGTTGSKSDSVAMKP